MSKRPTVLLLAEHAALAARVTEHVQRAGLRVVSGWHLQARDGSADATAVDVALVQLEYQAAHAPAFRRMAEQLGVRLIFFTAGSDGSSPHPTESAARGPQLGVPVLQLDADGGRFVVALLELLAVRAPRGR